MRNAGSTGARPRRLGPRSRRAALVVHIASAGAWFGMDIVMGVLIVTALSGDDARRALCYRALELFAGWPIVAAGLLCLASGVVLGLGTPFGILRYWWVVIKLVLNVVLVALVPIALRPEVVDLAEQGERFMAGMPANLGISDLIYPPIVAPTLMLVAITLAVFKPWGPIRKREVPARNAR